MKEKVETEIMVYPAEREKNVFKSICGKIIHYLENILEEANADIEAIVLVGELASSLYLTESIEDIRRRANTKCINPFFIHRNYMRFEHDVVLDGAFKKIVDKSNILDRVPRLVSTEDGEALIKSARDNSHQVLLFIDYTSKNTKVSYIHVQSGRQVAASSDVKSVTEWPGQIYLDSIFPTVDVMIFPSGKRIVSLRENDNHNKMFLEKVPRSDRENEYYTFKRSKRDIIQFVHRREKVGREKTYVYHDIEGRHFTQKSTDLCINEKELTSPTLSKSTSCSCKPPDEESNQQYTFTVTQKHISFQEYSMMYFECLISFLYGHIQSKLSAKNVKFQLYITRDSHNESDGFRLKDGDLYTIANRCGMLSADAPYHHDTSVVLERAENTAVCCRDLIGIFDTNTRKHDLGFIQLQLTSNQVLLLLYRVPLIYSEDSNVQVGKLWSGIQKHAKSKNIPFNFMETICQNLWIYVQKYQRDVLRKCGKHQTSKTFFNINNLKS